MILVFVVYLFFMFIVFVASFVKEMYHTFAINEVMFILLHKSLQVVENWFDAILI